MAKTTFKDVLDQHTLFQIAKDSQNLLREIMENNFINNWQETMNDGIEKYGSTHSNLECLALKAALHFNIYFTFGKFLFDTILIPITTLVEQIKKCDISQEDYPLKVFSVDIV